jgi:hypothetical protein
MFADLMPKLQWEAPNVDTLSVEDPRFMFPEPELMHSLFESYFENLNLFAPLLHKPSFLASVKGGLHKTDPYFGAVVLLVCAIGAKMRPLPGTLFDTSRPDSAGWQWFSEVQRARKPFLAAPRLEVLQMLVVSSHFMTSLL